jgi:hypothetical protein
MKISFVSWFNHKVKRATTLVPPRRREERIVIVEEEWSGHAVRSDFRAVYRCSLRAEKEEETGE